MPKDLKNGTRPREVLRDERRRTALGQIGIEMQEVETLTAEQITMAAQAARAFNGITSEGIGQPPTSVNLEMLEALATIHCTVSEMAVLLNVAPEVLERGVPRQVIDRARAKGKQALRRAQWKSALGGNVTSQIWLGKNELGQADVVAAEVRTTVVNADSPREEFMSKVNRIVERRLLGLQAGDAEQIVGDDNTDDSTDDSAVSPER